MRRLLSGALLAILILAPLEPARAQNPPPTSSNLQAQSLTLLPQTPLATVTSAQTAPSVQGNTVYYYWFVSNAGGVVSPPAGPFPTPPAPATLGGINAVRVTWTPVLGVTGYDVLRTTTSVAPSGNCGCAVITNTAVTQLTDNTPTASLGAYTVLVSPSQIPAILTNTSPIVTGAALRGTFSVVAYGAFGNTRELSGISGSYTNGGSGGAHSFTMISGPGFLATDVGKNFDCYNTAGPFQEINKDAIITSFTDANHITFNGTTTGSGGSSVNVCIVGNEDDTGVQSALVAAAAQPVNPGVYFPCGGYFLTTPPSSTYFSGALYGENSFCVTIYVPGDFAFGTLSSSFVMGVASGGLLQGITIDGLGQTNSTAGGYLLSANSTVNDVNVQNFIGTNANWASCLNVDTDHNGMLFGIRASNCGNGNGAVAFEDEGGSLIEPKIGGTLFSNEATISLVGGWVSTFNVTGQIATPNNVGIFGTAITQLNLTSHAGVFVSGSNLGNLTSSGVCPSSGNSTAVTVDATSVLNAEGNKFCGVGTGFGVTISAGGIYDDLGGNTYLIGNGGGQISGSHIMGNPINPTSPLAGTGTTLTQPSISSGFGTSPSIVQSNSEAAFEVNVGTGGTATSGVISTALSAAHGWACQATDMTTNIVTRETASTTSTVTFTAASAWTASDKLLINCFAF
jgi:hypothetical protein